MGIDDDIDRNQIREVILTLRGILTSGINIGDEK